MPRRRRRRQKEPTSVFWIFIILILGLFVASVMFFTKGQTVEVSEKNATIVDDDESRSSRVYTVTYRNGFFSPTNLRIHMGDTVRFKNEGILSIRIISESLPGFDSVGTIPRGGVFSYTFSSRGIFQYYNERNEEEIGTVIVR